MKQTNLLSVPPPDSSADDADLAVQENPDHGNPSQHPSGAAQTLLKPQEAKREAKSVLAGGGAVAGATAGVAVGAALAGPLGRSQQSPNPQRIESLPVDRVPVPASCPVADLFATMQRHQDR